MSQTLFKSRFKQNIPIRLKLMALFIGLSVAVSAYALWNLLSVITWLVFDWDSIVWIDPVDSGRRWFNYSIAGLSVLLGQNAAFQFLIQNSFAGRRRSTQLTALNDQNVHSWITFMVFGKIGFVALILLQAVFSYGPTDFHFFERNFVWILLFFLVLFLQSWTKLSLVIRLKKRIKLQGLNLLIIAIFAFGLGSYDVADRTSVMPVYKALDFMSEYKLEIEESDSSIHLWKWSWIEKVYIVTHREDPDSVAIFYNRRQVTMPNLMKQLQRSEPHFPPDRRPYLKLLVFVDKDVWPGWQQNYMQQFINGTNRIVYLAVRPEGSRFVDRTSQQGVFVGRGRRDVVTVPRPPGPVNSD